MLVHHQASLCLGSNVLNKHYEKDQYHCLSVLKIIEIFITIYPPLCKMCFNVMPAKQKTYLLQAKHHKNNFGNDMNSNNALLSCSLGQGNTCL